MLFIHLFAELLHCIAQQLGQNTVDSLHQKDSTETTTHLLTFTPTGNSVSSQLDGEEMRAQAQAETLLPPKTQRTRAQYCFGGIWGVLITWGRVYILQLHTLYTWNFIACSDLLVCKIND